MAVARRVLAARFRAPLCQLAGSIRRMLSDAAALCGRRLQWRSPQRPPAPRLRSDFLARRLRIGRSHVDGAVTARLASCGANLLSRCRWTNRFAAASSRCASSCSAAVSVLADWNRGAHRHRRIRQAWHGNDTRCHCRQRFGRDFVCFLWRRLCHWDHRRRTVDSSAGKARRSGCSTVRFRHDGVSRLAAHPPR